MSHSYFKFLYPLLLATFLLQAVAYSHSDYETALERRALELEQRAEQLQDVAALYRRALVVGLEDEFELTKRILGLGKKTQLEFKWDGVPTNWQQKIVKTIQKAYNSDQKRLGKYTKCEVKYGSRGTDNMIVTGRYYNGDKYVLGNPTITYNVIWK